MCTYRIGKGFGHEGLGLFQNLANIRGIAARRPLLRIGKDAKGNAATALATTRVTLVADLLATTATTRGRMDDVEALILVVADGKGRDAIVTVFLDATKLS